eukprot:gene10573-485_t
MNHPFRPRSRFAADEAGDGGARSEPEAPLAASSSIHVDMRAIREPARLLALRGSKEDRTAPCCSSALRGDRRAASAANASASR